MKKARPWIQYSIDLLVKWGSIITSLLLVSILALLMLAVQQGLNGVFGRDIIDFGNIPTLFLVLFLFVLLACFLSKIVIHLARSEKELMTLVSQQQEMLRRDQHLTLQLQGNIKQLNQEITDRKQVEKSRAQVMAALQVEMEQRESTQAELAQQSALLRSFLDSSPDLVYYRNEMGQFLGCNRAMELLLGKSEKQLIGLTPEQVYSPELAEKVMKTDDKVYHHNVALTYEQWLVYPDGRNACFELRKVPFYDRLGKRHGLMGFGRDITERKRYQEALENASREKTTFISTVSHELRTPLNGIVGLSRILLDMDLQPDQLNYLQTIHVSAIALGNIFNDIIDMDKFERRQVQLNNQPVEVIGFLSELENIAGLLAQPKGLAFSLEVQGEIPACLLLDGTRLRQILWNLIGNAVKFTQKGRIDVRVFYANDGQLCFDVEDSGIGIPLEEQERIFAMYYQVVDEKGGKPATGTGIGLAVSKRLAQVMGGDIFVSSKRGEGSCFTLTLNAPAVVESTLSPEVDALPAPQLHILLVEDIELNVIVARSVLEKLGNTVDVAMNGQEALTRFSPDSYDLVLLDIQLPDMTGFDIARTIREQYATEPLPPLIALTANVLKDKQEYLKAGMDDVLSKPLSVSALRSVIKHYWQQPMNTECEELAQSDADEGAEWLDLEMLEQYLALLGAPLIDKSLLLFEQMMPSYLAILNSSMTRRDQEAITEEGHKIKGAAGSVGLKRLQVVAKQIQTPSSPAWWDNVQTWIDELNREWRNDVNRARKWLSNQEKNNPDG